MSKNKGLVLIFLGLVLAAIGFAILSQRAEAPVPESQTATTTSETTAPRTFSWRLETDESGDGLAPRTQVALITNGDVYNAGIYAGSCAEIAAENLLPNEVSGVLCWFAGGGDEIGVFREGERYVLKRGVQEESTAESDGFRGDFKEIAVIE